MATIQYTDLAGVLTATIINGGIFLLLLVLFSYLRPKKPNVFQPKAVENELLNSLSAWLEPVLSRKYSENDLIKKMGLDAYMFLAFIKLVVDLFGYLTLFAVPLMILNYYAPTITNTPIKVDQNNTTLSLTLLTMNNIPAGSNLFFIPAVFAYAFSVLTFYMLFVQWQHFILLRQDYFESPEYKRAFESKLLLFTDQPKDRQNAEKFTRYLDTLHLTCQPASIQFGKDLKDLPKLVAKHLELTIKFEHVLSKYLKDPLNMPEKRPEHRQGGLGGIIGGKLVDSIDYYKQEIGKLEKEIYEIKSKSDDEFDFNSSCFVQFKSIREAHLATKQLFNPYYRKVAFRPAPTFTDILWENISVSPLLKFSRKAIAKSITAALIIGWIALGALIATVAGQLISFAPLSTSTIVFLQSILTPTIAVVLNILLPIFLRIIAKLQGVSSISGVERSALYKFFVFQIYQLLTQLAASVVSSFVLNLIQGKGLGDLGELVDTLSSAFVGLSTYYITFIVTGLTSFGVALLQIAPLIVAPLMEKYMAATPRDKNAFAEPQYLDYLAIYGFLLLTFLLAMSYSVVAPLIIPFSYIVFASAHVVYKYLMMYVFETQFETGGSWFPKVFNMVISCLIVFQILTAGAIGVIGGKENAANPKIASLLVFILVIFTVLFWCYIHYFVEPKSKYMKDCEFLEDATTSTTPVGETGESHLMLSDPVICQDLTKVWVDAKSQEVLNDLYRPEYQGVVDYVSQTHPDDTEKLVEIKRIQAHRNVQKVQIEAQLASSKVVIQEPQNESGLSTRCSTPQNVVVIPSSSE